MVAPVSHPPLDDPSSHFTLSFLSADIDDYSNQNVVYGGGGAVSVGKLKSSGNKRGQGNRAIE